ncbi:hypothetical protein CIB48_g4149 [Xylaria polymorpha]|nr:hypothetical protein CIB48_g4149 [Xylaria polymorpha]
MSGPNGEKMPPASDDNSTKSANTNGNTVTPKTKNKNNKAQGRAHDMLAYTQRQVDRVMSPSTRQKAIDSTTAFASKRPLLSVRRSKSSSSSPPPPPPPPPPPLTTSLAPVLATLIVKVKENCTIIKSIALYSSWKPP